jgi:hypothetical protein
MSPIKLSIISVASTKNNIYPPIKLNIISYQKTSNSHMLDRARRWKEESKWNEFARIEHE